MKLSAQAKKAVKDSIKHWMEDIVDKIKKKEECIDVKSDDNPLGG